MVSRAGEAPETVETTLKVLLKAVKEANLAQFESVCDDRMKETMTEKIFTKVSDDLSKVMKEGYRKEYLGVIDKHQAKVYLWKVDFQRGGYPDMLAEMTVIPSGQVAGFFIR